MPKETKPRNDWTREQVLAGLHIYLQLNYGQLHARNPKIKELGYMVRPHCELGGTEAV